MSDIIEIGIPMWGIGGDEELDQQASIIAETRKKINATDTILDELEEQLTTLSNRANMYIKNAIKMNDYNNLTHMITIDDKLRAKIYPIEEYVNAESLDELHTDIDVQLTRKQSNRIIELMFEYNELIEEYEEYTESYEDLVAYHDETWEEVVDTLINFSGLHVYDSDSYEEIEQYDQENHILLIVKDEKDKWVFRYIRKEDEEEFNLSFEEDTTEINK